MESVFEREGSKMAVNTREHRKVTFGLSAGGAAGKPPFKQWKKRQKMCRSLDTLGSKRSPRMSGGERSLYNLCLSTIFFFCYFSIFTISPVMAMDCDKINIGDFVV